MAAVVAHECLRPPSQTYRTCVEYFFLNPLSGDRVMLPSRSTISDYGNNPPRFFEKVVVSSIPTKQHCIVAGLDCYSSKLYVCRHHIDKSWTRIETLNEIGYCGDIEIVGNKLYASKKTGSKIILTVFNIREFHDGGPHSYTAETFSFRPNFVDNLTVHTYWTTNLAKGSAPEEAFVILSEVICKYNAWRLTYTETRGFRVLKLDFNTNSFRWIEVSDLGDQILFSSRWSSKFITSNNGGFRRYLRNERLQRNSIYFASSHSRNGFGVFSSSKGNIKPLTFPRNHSVDFVRRSVW